MRIINIIKGLSEFSTVVVAFALFMLFPRALRFFYPEAGDIDPVVFQRTFYLVFQILIIHAVVWLLWKLTWKDIAAYLDNDFCNDFKNLDKWQKLLLVSLLWASYLVYAAMIVMGGVMS